MEGLGLVVLGETWVNRHGKHKVEGTRGVIEAPNADHPVLRGVKDVFGPSDVYSVTHLNPEAKILFRGAVTTTLDLDSPALAGGKNNPMMPLAWLREYQIPNGKKGRAFCSTMGASLDFLSEDLRRLIVNAVYEFADQKVPAKAEVAFVDPFTPSFLGFCRWKRGRNGRSSRPISAWAKPAAFRRGGGAGGI